MRTIIHGCGRLCALAVAFCFNNLTSWGHDLPHDRNLPEQATLNCFSTVSHPTDSDTSHLHSSEQEDSKHFINDLGNQAWLSELPVSSLSANLLHAWQTVASQAEQMLKSMTKPLCHNPLSVSSAQSYSTCDLAIARPDKGNAPRPRAQGILQQENAFAQILRLIEDAQCHTNQALFDRQTLQHTIAKHTYHGFQTVSRLAAKFAVPQDSLPTDAPQSIGPQYVIFETSVGGHIILTIAQAQQWQFAVPTAKNSVAKFLNATGHSLQQRAFTAISGQLEWVGKSLLDLSQTMSPLAPAKVADRANSYH